MWCVCVVCACYKGFFGVECGMCMCGIDVWCVCAVYGVLGCIYDMCGVCFVCDVYCACCTCGVSVLYVWCA